MERDRMLPAGEWVGRCADRIGFPSELERLWVLGKVALDVSERVGEGRSLYRNASGGDGLR
jgi:hypothetical protein